MSVTVTFPALLSDRIGGVDRVSVGGHSVAEVLDALTTRHPALSPLIWTPESTINPVLVLFVNGTQLSDSVLDASVGDGDEITIVPAIEGGSWPVEATIGVEAPRRRRPGAAGDVARSRSRR